MVFIIIIFIFIIIKTIKQLTVTALKGNVNNQNSGHMLQIKMTDIERVKRYIHFSGRNKIIILRHPALQLSSGSGPLLIRIYFHLFIKFYAFKNLKE